MSKKILSVILSLVMVMSLLTGCGEKESTFFKEVKEISKISAGSGTVEMNIVTDAEEEMPEQFLDANGKMAVSIQAEVKQESKKKAAMKFLIKFGKDTEYKELTTIAVNDTKIYIDVASIISLVQLFNEETATNIQQSLSQIGVTDSIAVDYKQLAKAMGTEIPETKVENSAETLKKLNEIFDKVENDFKDLQGKDGDDYTLTVNGDNADKAVDALVTFFEKDFDDIMKIYVDIVKSALGEDNELSQMYEEMLADTSSIKDAVKELKDSKESVVKEIKDSNINVVAKAKASAKEGTISFDTGDITVEEDGKKETANIHMSMTVKEEKVSIDDMIPADASDITTLLVTMLNQMQQSVIDEGLDDDLKIQ